MPAPDKLQEQDLDALEALYNQRIRPVVELPENAGKEVVYDANTGEFEIDVDPIQASRRLRERLPSAVPVGRRIGYRLIVDVLGRPRYVRE